MLLEEETVLRAFKEGRELFIYTNRRKLTVAPKGLSGQSVKYFTIPYRSITALEFETAGHMDRHAEIYVYADFALVISTRYPRIVPLAYAKQSIRVKHTDIYEISKLILDHTVSDKTLPTSYVVPEIEIHY